MASKIALIVCTLMAPLVAVVLPGQALSEHHLSSTVNEYVAAYNAKDIDKMLALASDEIRWITAREKAAKIETTGKTELAEALKRYFEVLPTSRSEVRIVTESGKFVLVEEIASWNDEGRTMTQCAPASYEFDGDKILNVTYYVDNACENSD